MKAPVLVTMVVGLHVGVIGVFLFAQGCGTTRPTRVDEAPPPVMPPRATQVPPVDPVQPRLLPPASPRTEPVPMPAIGTYTVRRGDSLTAIAQRLGVSWRELAELNALREPYRILEGQSLLVPGYTGEIEPPPRPSTPAPAAAQRPSGPGVDYVVQAGDSLSGIAQRFGVRWRDVATANGLEEPYRIRIGQTLRIPGATSARPAAPAPAAPVPAPRPAAPVRAVEDPAPAVAPAAAPQLGAGEPFPYRVVEGDTLETIAQWFLVGVNDLMTLNNITDPAAVRPGQTILIPHPRGD